MRAWPAGPSQSLVGCGSASTGPGARGGTRLPATRRSTSPSEGWRSPPRCGLGWSCRSFRNDWNVRRDGLLSGVLHPPRLPASSGTVETAHMNTDIRALTERVQQESSFVELLNQEVGKVIVGQRYMLERILIGLLCNGHVLLEGVPGLAKTLTVRTIADSLSASFMRIQFTPDLLPADVVGTMIYNQQAASFTVRKGPV